MLPFRAQIEVGDAHGLRRRAEQLQEAVGLKSPDLIGQQDAVAVTFSRRKF